MDGVNALESRPSAQLAERWSGCLHAGCRLFDPIIACHRGDCLPRPAPSYPVKVQTLK